MGSYGRKNPGDTYNKSNTQRVKRNNTKVIWWREGAEKGQNKQRKRRELNGASLGASLGAKWLLSQTVKVKLYQQLN